MLQVSVRVKRSPTFTAFRSVFHQQEIGSTSTSPGACGTGGRGAGVAAFGRAGAVAAGFGADGVWPACAFCAAWAASPTPNPPATRPSTTNTPVADLSLM